MNQHVMFNLDIILCISWLNMAPGLWCSCNFNLYFYVFSSLPLTLQALQSSELDTSSVCVLWFTDAAIQSWHLCICCDIHLYNSSTPFCLVLLIYLVKVSLAWLDVFCLILHLNVQWDVITHFEGAAKVNTMFFFPTGSCYQVIAIHQ